MNPKADQRAVDAAAAAIEARGRAADCPLTERELFAARIVGEHYDIEMRRVLHRVIVCVAAVALIAISGNVLGWVLTRDEGVERTAQLDTEAKNRARELAGEAKARADAIQASRLELLVDSCKTTNRRHRATIAALKRFLPPRPTRSESRETGATVIVSAILPLTKDCEATARKRLEDSTPPPNEPTPPPVSTP